MSAVAYSSNGDVIAALGKTTLNGGVAYHFSPGKLYAHPGDTIKLVDPSDEVHTMTFVVKSDLPANATQWNLCGIPYPGIPQICGGPTDTNGNPYPLPLHLPKGPPPPIPVIPHFKCTPTFLPDTPCYPFVANGVECSACASSWNSPFVLNSNKPNHGLWNVGPSPAPGTTGAVISAGDSFLTLPGSTYYIQIPASTSVGTVLHYMCLFHPWMQGEIVVV
jgi:hypothetical protein